MFEIGDRVKNVYRDSKRFGQVGEVIDVDDEAEKIEVEYLDGYIGGGKFKSYKNLDRVSTLSTKIKSTSMSFLKKVKDHFLSEPEKTYRKLGLKDDEGNLTDEGAEFLINVLWDANEATLVREKANAILEAQEKDN